MVELCLDLITPPYPLLWVKSYFVIHLKVIGLIGGWFPRKQKERTQKSKRERQKKDSGYLADAVVSRNLEFPKFDRFTADVTQNGAAPPIFPLRSSKFSARDQFEIHSLQCDQFV